MTAPTTTETEPRPDRKPVRDPKPPQLASERAIVAGNHYTELTEAIDDHFLENSDA